MSHELPPTPDTKKPQIKHNDYGNVHSLGFNSEGHDFTVGVVLPGEYNFGKATRREIIKVQKGKITINNVEYDPASPECVIEPGSDIVISCRDTGVYLCRYE